MGRPRRGSIGPGLWSREDLAYLGSGAVIEDGVRIFHPENVSIGDDVYIGHDTFIHGYHSGRVEIGSGTWIGPRCYMHGAGGLVIEEDVGVGPNVSILTSAHDPEDSGDVILHRPLTCSPVRIERGADIGCGSIVLQGVVVGAGAQIGAGAVVTGPIPAACTAVGVPARVTRHQ